ncbi:TonB-dependent receptor domain-containing protein [Chondrinema litorale]|uniref:TonB-dependent receptor domain-containing protein n=1 Tax=Chondrinema litorale TaxID=2994555 RepID=UPI002543E227|nr:TonB-dependent receptor [Chondrinema litorale]UZR99933.1 TonB-dependent receptor [Chondrinema litorale]
MKASVDKLKSKLYFVITLLILSVMGRVCPIQAQDKVEVNEEFNEAPLTEVIQKMKQNYNLEIAFEKAVIEEIKVNASIKNASLEKAWEYILDDTGLEYILLAKNRLVIRRSKNTEVKDSGLSVSENGNKFVLTGIIKDSETGEAIPYATVWLPDRKEGTVANQEGYFSLTASGVNPDSIRISHLGYQSNTISLQAFKQGLMEVQLTSSPAYLKEVEVSNTPPEIIDMNGESGQVTINPKEVSKLPQIGEKDIFRSLQLLPGISISNENASGLQVRGGLPDQNLVIFDGFTIYHLDHLFGFFSSINMNAVKDIRMYKGGFDARYGGRISSVLDITGKTGNKYKPSVNIGLNMLSADVTAEAPLSDKLTALVSFRRSYTDIVQTPLFDKIYNYAEFDVPELSVGFNRRNTPEDVDDNYYYYDVHSKLSWNPTEKDVISFSFYRGKDDYFQSENIWLKSLNKEAVETKSEDYILSNTGAGIKWSRYWNERLFSTASVGYSKYNKDYYTNISSSFMEYDSLNANSISIGRYNELKELAARLDFEYHLNTKNLVDFGVFLVNNDISYEDNVIGSSNTKILGTEGMQAGFFAQNTFKPVNNLSITAGLRNTYYSATNKFHLAPRLSLTWEMSSDLIFSASAGRYYQFISQAGSDLPNTFNQDFWVLAGNGDVSLLTAEHYQTGFLYKKNDWTAEIGFYYRNIDGLVRAGYQNLMDASALRSEWEFQRLIENGTGAAKGMDVYLGKQMDNSAISASYSLASVKNQFDQLNNGIEFYADNDQRHEVKLMYFLESGKFNFSLDWVYGSGLPYSSPTQIVSEEEEREGRYESVTRILYTDKNNERLPVYNRMDASLSYDLKIGKIFGNVGCSIFNLYDRDNVGSRSFIYDKQDIYNNNQEQQQIQRLFYYDQYLLGRSFSLFLNLKF